MNSDDAFHLIAQTAREKGLLINDEHGTITIGHPAILHETGVRQYTPLEISMLDPHFCSMCQIGRDHALIASGYAGVVCFASHERQKEEGIFERVQYNHGLCDHPKTLARQRNEGVY